MKYHKVSSWLTVVGCAALLSLGAAVLCSCVERQVLADQPVGEDTIKQIERLSDENPTYLDAIGPERLLRAETLFRSQKYLTR